jgi:hypothetical protein
VEHETITYYPGDPMVLEVQIEHKPNFRRVEAVFRGRPDREGVSPFSGAPSPVGWSLMRLNCSAK